MRRILIDDAIRAIHPDAQFTTVDGVITEWKGPGVVPSDEELNAKFVPDFGARLPVAVVTNSGKQVVSEDSSATVTVVAMAAVPVVF